MKGNLIISLDFELHWGGVELWDIHERKDYFLETRKSIRRVLELFKKYEIRATWATVGFLFAKNKEQLISFSPSEKPSYENNRLQYYSIIENGVGEDEIADPFHFADSLIREILKTPNQELGSHTFSHYYCNENGQTIEQFTSDLEAAQNIARENYNVELKSLVFPRNQFNKDYVKVAKNCGFTVVRSNPDVWFWSKTRRYNFLFRAIDTLLPISKSLTFETPIEKDIVALPASRFFRPFTPKESFIQTLKIRRIKSEMRYAAKNGRNYHLWWHPHNFGYCSAQNETYLEEIILYFKKLQTKYGFQTKFMGDFSNEEKLKRVM